MTPSRTPTSSSTTIPPRDLKSVSPRLQVGGPATAQAAWVTPFLAHVHAINVPIDFVSTHVYANDTAPNVLHTNEDVPRETMVYRAVKMVHDQILASPYPAPPAHLLRVQRQLLQRAQRHRLHLHRPLARQHHPPLRRPHRQHGLLGLLRRLRRAGRRPHPLLRRLRPHRRRAHPQARAQRLPRSSTSSATAASPSTPTPP